MSRFLHTADWQIGRQYGQFSPEDAVPLAQARLAAVATLARLATEHAVDAVLVAGDVFDAQTIGERTIRQMFNAMEGFTGPWIMIPGNHDAALAESIWTHAQRLGVLPPNLYLALQPQVFEFAAAGFAALCAPLTQRQTYHDLTEPFDTIVTAPGLLRIGLAHGSVQGILAEDVDSANPIAPERAQRARLDYLALGDWHGCKRIDSRTWYSGTPEADRFRGNAPGFALLVEIAAPGAEPQVTQLATGRFSWREWEHELAVASDAEVVVARLDTVQADEVLRVTLRGHSDLAGLQQIRAAHSRAGARATSLEVDFSGLRLLPTDADIAALHADGYLGEVLGELRERQRIGADGSGGDGDEAALAAHALGLLTTLLAERQHEGAQP